MFEPTAADARAWAVAATGDPDVDATHLDRRPRGVRLADADDGRACTAIIGPTWSVFVKVVQSFRHWDLLDLLPPEMRARALATTAWRYEADLYRSDLGALLPAGMRLPAVYDRARRRRRPRRRRHGGRRRRSTRRGTPAATPTPPTSSGA